MNTWMKHNETYVPYPDRERDFEWDRERETDLEGDLAGERCEDLPFGDLLHDKIKETNKC